MLAICAAIPPCIAGVTLDQCVEKAIENYPLTKRYALTLQSGRLDLSNIDKDWLPKINAYAQATIQNNVPELPTALTSMLAATDFDIPGLRKDQYKIGIDLNQTIWDGGVSAAQRRLAESSTEKALLANEVELYAVKERVEALFFGILLTDEQIKQTDLTIGLLENNLKKLKSLHANGAAMQSDVDAVEAQLLSTRQNRSKLQSAAQSQRSMLELYTHIPLNGETLICPSANEPSTFEPDRPELRMLDANLAEIESRQRLLNTSTMPRIGFFAQTFYGYPGYDYFKSMTSRDWTINAIAGIKLSWTIDSFYTRKNDRAKLAIAANETELNRDVFLFNTNLQATSQSTEIENLKALIADDSRITELRTSVRKAAESQLANGVIDTTALLDKITAEASAELNAAYHRIELIQTIYKLKHTLNR